MRISNIRSKYKLELPVGEMLYIILEQLRKKIFAHANSSRAGTPPPRTTPPPETFRKRPKKVKILPFFMVNM